MGFLLGLQPTDPITIDPKFESSKIGDYFFNSRLDFKANSTFI